MNVLLLCKYSQEINPLGKEDRDRTELILVMYEQYLELISGRISWKLGLNETLSLMSEEGKGWIYTHISSEEKAFHLHSVVSAP